MRRGEIENFRHILILILRDSLFNGKLCGVRFFPEHFYFAEKIPKRCSGKAFFVKFALVEGIPHTVMYLVAISTQCKYRDHGKLAACFTANLLFKHSTNSTNFLRKDFQEYHKTASMFPHSSLLKNAQGRKEGGNRIRKRFYVGYQCLLCVTNINYPCDVDPLSGCSWQISRSRLSGWKK